MNWFTPHNFEPSYEMTGDPSIVVSKCAANKMYLIVDNCDEEVGWLGTADQIGPNTFKIDDIFLLRQNVHSTTTEIDPEAINEFYHETLGKEGGQDLCNRIRFWGHSHVDMPTSPSSQDDNQMEEFRESNNPWFIRGILNKHGKIEFSLYLYELEMIVRDVPWHFEEPEIPDAIREQILKDIKEKVQSKETNSIMKTSPWLDPKRGLGPKMKKVRKGK